MFRAVSAFVVALSVIHTAHAGPLEDGLAAYETGDYTSAHTLWSQQKKDKSAASLWAQYYLGILYEYGLGVEKNLDQAREYYRPTRAKISGYILHSEEKKKAHEGLPIDALYRLAMLEVQRSLEMEQSEDKKVRQRAVQVMQEARILFDHGGFFRHAESFYQVGLLEMNGTGKRFVKNEESAWAHFTLAAEFGHAKAKALAQKLEQDFNRFEKRDAKDVLKSYRKYIRPPY